MRTAPLITPPPGRIDTSTPNADTPAAQPMDREFVVRNQITERYISGRLPPRGAQDFERFCREHPELIDELKLADRVHAGLRLLEAGGVAPPWEEKPRQWWEKLPVFIAAAALALSASVAALVLTAKVSGRDDTIVALQKRVAEQPLDPATSTRTVRLIPSRTAPSRRPVVTIGGGNAQMADLKIDMSWSKFTAFKLTLDRQDQGRVAVLNYMLRDSNGDLHLSLNNTAFGPGIYQFAIEGLTLHGGTIAQAWITVGIAH